VNPLTALRAALIEQGWTEGGPLTMVSDGDAALPDLMRATTGGPVHRILH
jgi:hypothetical protein